MRINEICVYAPKSSIKAGDACENGEYAFFTSSDDENKRYIDYQFDGEGIIMGTGGKATLHYYNGKYAVSTDCVVLFPNECVQCKYLYYFFKKNLNILEAGFKGAGLRHTNKGYIGNIDFGDIPSQEHQSTVIETLDKAQSIIKIREKQLFELDTLIKARFVEMFGDPAYNPKGWKTKTFREASMRLSDGPFGSNLKSEHYSNSGVRVIRLGNIGVGKFIDTDKSYIPYEHYETLKKYTCKSGEIVIGTLGEPNLRACLIPEDIEVAVNKADCVHYVPNYELLPKFVCQYINCPETLLLASSMMHGQTRTRISSGQIAEMPIFIPPIELQQQFANFVEQIDKSKVVIQKALDEAQILFDSLMQEYFG
jgi:type I restriction enzyme S subunit